MNATTVLRPIAFSAEAGRDPEHDVLRNFLDRVAAGGGALLLRGDRKGGKTAALGAVTRDAADRGMAVVSVGGAPGRAQRPMSGLRQIVAGLAAYREAASGEVRPIAGLTGGASDRLLLCSVILTLVQDIAAARPLLLAVDDLHLFDGPSTAVLTLVARRMAGTGAGLLATYSAGTPGFVDGTGLAELELRRVGQPVTSATSLLSISTRRWLRLDSDTAPFASAAAR